MKRVIYIILFISSALTACANKDKNDFVYEAPVPLGDPFIMLYENTYYAYGTNAENGIEVHTSDAMYISDVTFTDDAVPVMKISEDILRPKLAR